jgi:hypothetical protein
MPLGGSNLARLDESSHLMESPPQELPGLSIPRAGSNSSSAIISVIEPGRCCWTYAGCIRRCCRRKPCPGLHNGRNLPEVDRKKAAVNDRHLEQEASQPGGILCTKRPHGVGRFHHDRGSG